MARKFRPYSLDQQFLLPPCLNDWVPDNHLARFIVDATNQLDLSALFERYEGADGRGLPGYHRVMLLRLLLYGYCIGRRSSRKIEKATYDEVAFRYLAGDQHPDHDTIAAFRQENLEAIAALFGQVLRLCREAGLVKLGVVAIDGTKMRANADRNQTLRYRDICEQEQALEAQVRRLLEEAAQTDADEDGRYGKGNQPQDLPPELASAEQRREKLRAAKQKLEREAAARAEAARREREANGGKHRRDAAKKRFRRETRPVDKANPQQNLTDGDSKIMKNPAGGFLQGYNAQAAADGEAQIIVAAEVSNSAADQTLLVPMTTAVERETAAVAEATLGDSGYFSVEGLQNEAVRNWYILVSPESRLAQKQGKYRCRHAIAERMRAELATEAGQKLYRQRAGIIEPVFAYIKQARGIRAFLLRGLEKVRGEWRLICLTHNLLKLFTHDCLLKAPAAAAA
jgi:transposase